MKTQALRTALQSAALLLALPAGVFAYGWTTAALPGQETISPNRDAGQKLPPAVEAPKPEQTPADKGAQDSDPEKDKQSLSDGTAGSGATGSGSGVTGSGSGVVASTDEGLTKSGEKLFDGGKDQKESPVVPATDNTLNSGNGTSPSSDSQQQTQTILPKVKGLDTSFPVPPPSLGVEMKGTRLASVPSGTSGDTSSFDEWTQAIKKRLSGAWDTVSGAVTGTIDSIKELLTKLGDGFSRIFMSVWKAADTKSVGTVNHGALVNGINMTTTPWYKVANRRETWGAKHMILGLMYIGGRLTLEGAPVMTIGDISAANGGKLGGHKSHQAGLDVDIPFFYKGGVHDAWANYRVLYHLCNNPFFRVTIAFVSPRVKTMLLAAARKDGHPEIANWANGVLNTNEPGHDNHFHVRISPQSKLSEWMKNLF